MVNPLLLVIISQNLSSPHIPPIAITALLLKASFREEEIILKSFETASCLNSSSRHLLSVQSSEMISAAISATLSSFEERWPTRCGSVSDRRRNSLDLLSEERESEMRHRRAASEMLGSLLPACANTSTSPLASEITSQIGWSSHRFASTWSAGPSFAEIMSNFCSSEEIPNVGSPLTGALGCNLMHSSIRLVPPISKSDRRHSALKDVKVDSNVRHTSISEMWLDGLAAMDARTPTPDP
mmetsp:Transcript_9409/g.31473  ORF Transcript_9409/g.31473 Transcript_9409/m.31473 type:complete len:240 (-) Transcript_9409:1651-2370(-)